MSTIPLNDALKAQKFDNVNLYQATIDEVTTAPGTIYLGNVTLENNFPKYMTVADEDGGYLLKAKDGKLYSTSQLVRDESILHGDAATECFMLFSGDGGMYATPAFYNSAVPLSTVHTDPGAVTTTTIGGQTV